MDIRQTRFPFTCMGFAADLVTDLFFPWLSFTDRNSKFFLFAIGEVTHAEISAWLDSFSRQKGRRVDLRDCNAFQAAVDEQCAFNSTEVQRFSQESKQNNGDYTIAFWMKPLGEISFNEYRKRFIPHIQFLSSISPPQHNVAFGHWENPNGEARMFSNCSQLVLPYTNIEMKT